MDLLQTVIEHRLDLLATALLAVATVVCAQLVLVRRHGCRLPPLTWVLAGIVVGGACVLSEVQDRAERHTLQAQIQSMSPVYADELEQMGHWKLSFDTPANDPSYLTMIEAEKRWLRLNPGVADIYTLRTFLPRGVKLLVDSETDYDGNGVYDGDREQRTPIGEELDSVSNAAMVRAATTGKTYFDDKPATDRWGTWISSYTPLKDPTGRVEGILGVDYPADLWVLNIAWQRSLPLGSGLLIVVVVAFSSSAVTAMRNEIRRRNEAEAALIRSETRISQLVLEDRLTSLPNRRAFEQALAQAVLASESSSPGPASETFSLLYVDLDGFGAVNEELGNIVGDQMLVQAANRLRTIAQEQQSRDGGACGQFLVGRLAADEFAILSRGPRAASYAVEMGNRVSQAMSAPYKLDDRDVTRTASVGLTSSSLKTYTSAERAMRDASLAMYRAKAAGGGELALYDQASEEQASRRLMIETDLRRAIDRHEFELFYQPIVSLESGQLFGFEALIRWRHPSRGLINPIEFIPLAEESGLIVPIGMWALREACSQLAIWQRRYDFAQALTVSVNVSRRQFSCPRLAEDVTRAIAESHVRPGTVALEITESTVLHDPAAAAATMQRFRDFGLKLYLDDFGTGHSSLSCLHTIHADVLKVDKAFMVTGDVRRDYVAVLHAIVTMAQNLNITLVAEGVETMEQVAMLQALGCQRGQGYLFAKPLPAHAAEQFLRDSVKKVRAA